MASQPMPQGKQGLQRHAPPAAAKMHVSWHTHGRLTKAALVLQPLHEALGPLLGAQLHSQHAAKAVACTGRQAQGGTLIRCKQSLKLASNSQPGAARRKACTQDVTAG